MEIKETNIDLTGVFTPTGLVTAVRAAALSERQLRAVLKVPHISDGTRRIVIRELRTR